MSQKKVKARRKEAEKTADFERENTKAAAAHYKNGRKPWLARAYDKLIPGDYTAKQDLHHMIAVFAVVVVVLGAFAFMFYNQMENEKYSVSDKLLIPKTSFVSGQESNVVSMLEGYGFKNITTDESGNIIGYGTPEMVDAYKTSYEDNILAPVKEDMLEDYSLYGIVAISTTDDAKTMTIKTYDKEAVESSNGMRATVGDDEINNIIYVCSNWCQIRNDGEKMTVNMELVGESEPYFSCQPMNGEAMVAEMEKTESESTDTGTSDGTGEEETDEGTEQ